MKDKTDLRALVHTPSDMALEFIEYAERIRVNPGITWGVPSMDKVTVPMRAGDVIGIIARPGHGKTTMAAYLARKTGKDLMAAGRADSECVIYVSLEQQVEEIEAMFQVEPDGTGITATDIAWGRSDIEELKRRAVKRLSLPVWLMGASTIRRRRVPRMTVENIYRTLATIEDDYKIRPALIVLDYVQIIPVERASERMEQVTEAIIRAKSLAQYVGAPMVLCVQAARRVDTYDNKIPAASDCQWASAIEQTADKLIGIWRPSLTEEPGATIDIGKQEIVVTPKLFIVRLLKQRMADAGQTFILNFAPEFARLADMELRNIGDSH